MTDETNETPAAVIPPRPSPAEAREAAEALRAALAAGAPARIEIAEGEAPLPIAVQLLLAARVSAERSGRAVAFGPRAEAALAGLPA